jgi:hypothetical protein
MSEPAASEPKITATPSEPAREIRSPFNRFAHLREWLLEFISEWYGGFLEEAGAWFKV